MLQASFKIANILAITLLEFSYAVWNAIFNLAFIQIAVSSSQAAKTLWLVISPLALILHDFKVIPCLHAESVSHVSRESSLVEVSAWS